MKRIFNIYLVLLSAQVFGASLDLSKSKNSVEFLAVGQPSALRIRGKTNTDKVKEPMKGSLAITANTLIGTATYNLAALDTGIEMRDTHMKDKYLEVPKYPQAELTITKLNLPESHKGENLPFEGQLTLHGVKKPISGTANIEKTGSSLNTKFEYKILLANFGIEIPSYMGIKIANEVTVTTTAEGNVQ